MSDVELLELRIEHLKQLIAESGDDARANRFSDMADALQRLGRIEEAGRALLVAAQRCQEHAQDARAAMLARRAFQLDSSLKEPALTVWRATSGLDDADFFAVD